MKSYECITDKSIIEVKVYLLMNAKGLFKQEIHDIINSSIDIKQIRNNISKRKDIELYLFTRIKKLLDASESLTELEEHLVFMNILLNNSFKPMICYKYNLFNYITDSRGFTIDNYCILRHLIKFDYKQLSQFIKYMCQRFNVNDEHYLSSNILLLEKQYKLAYKHLVYIQFDDGLEKYKNSLYYYSPRKFEKYINNKEVDNLIPMLN